MFRHSVLIAAALLVPSGAALAAGGTIVGTVRLDGASVARQADLHQHAIVKDASVCGKHAPNETLIVGKDRRLANVVVSVTAATEKKQGAGKSATAAERTLDQQQCRYVPHVQALTVPTTLTVINSDAVLHNVNARLIGTSNDTPVFNVPTPFKGHRLKQALTRPGVVNVRCDAGHTWMGAWLVAFDHPYFAVTGANGDFTIPEVPVGTWKVEFWHEPLPGQAGTGPVRTVDVKVVAGQNVRADLDFKL